MYTLAEFNQLEVNNKVLTEKVTQLEFQITKMKRDERAIKRKRIVIDRYYNKRVAQVIALKDTLSVNQLVGVCGFPKHQIIKIIKDSLV